MPPDFRARGSVLRLRQEHPLPKTGRVNREPAHAREIPVAAVELCAFLPVCGARNLRNSVSLKRGAQTRRELFDLMNDIVAVTDVGIDRRSGSVAGVPGLHHLLFKSGKLEIVGVLQCSGRVAQTSLLRSADIPPSPKLRAADLEEQVRATCSPNWKVKRKAKWPRW